MNPDNVTILLQGLISDEINLQEVLEKYSKLGRLVISIYDYQLEKLKPYVEAIPNCLVIINNQDVFLSELLHRQIPEKTQTDECHKCFFQIRSIENALQHISTEYVLYCRINHLYSNLDKVIEEGVQHKKFVISSFVTRGTDIRRWRFHFSDCMIFGTKEKMKLLFYLAARDYTYDNILYRPNECRIWRPYFLFYFMQHGLPHPDNLTNQEYVQELDKHMIIVPFQTLAPFRIFSQKEVRTESFYTPEEKTTAEYLHTGIKCIGY